jgi:NAD-dependent deacetylase
LHRTAGTSEEKLVEVHGTGTLVECQTCGQRNPVEASFELFKQTRQPPLCDCGGFLKPATISFGQNLREADLQKAFSAAAACDLVIALGSTLSVSPANTIPLAAAQAGVSYIIINRDETDHDRMSQVTLRLSGNVEEIFPPAVEKALAG